MKILMLGWELPPHNSGGLGVACLQLCKAMSSKSDIDIEFVLPYDADHDVDFMTVTAAIPQDVDHIFSAGGVYDSHRYVYRDGTVECHDIVSQQHMFEHSVGRIVEGKTYDVIHAHDWLTFRAGLKARLQLGVPLVVHVHSIERDRAGGSDGNPIVREIESVAFRTADRIIAVSEHTRHMIAREYDIPLDKIEVIHNSIDRSFMIPLDQANAYHYLTQLKSEGWKIVANVGRLTVQKGLRNLLLAAREVVARQPQTMFLIVGSGEQYHELLALSAELGIARNVIFTGFQRGKNWRDSFGIADLFVMPSISEPYGLTVLESIAYGTPTLISNQSGVSESILNCLRIDYWDVPQMANMITAAVREESLLNELQHNAYRELEKLSWHSAADSILDLYDRHIRPENRQVAGIAI